MERCQPYINLPGRLGVQHRDVPQAIAQQYADVGIIFHHLAQHYAAADPELYALIMVPGAERLSSTIAMTSTVDPLRAQAAKASSTFFRDGLRGLPTIWVCEDRQARVWSGDPSRVITSATRGTDCHAMVGRGIASE